MSQIVVVKVGSTFPSLIRRKGDFEDWILSGMGLHPDLTLVVDVRCAIALPEHDQVLGIVVTGSHASVTDHHDWSERTAGWLAEAVARGIPILGICYGHQLLAYALGGEVGDNPNGREYGTVEIQLTANAQGDALFGRLPAPLRVHLSHAQTVLRLPDEARRLAFSAMDGNQAFVVGSLAWGVQFHPEYDAEVAIEYLHQDRDALVAEKQNPDYLIETCVDAPQAGTILRRFTNIVFRSPMGRQMDGSHGQR
jgi:GMP synthase (glutamine-hydrolysing)